MEQDILVTGGTGTLGRHVVERLRESGRRVRILSREAHEPATGIDYVVGDLRTGDGVDAAVDGVGIVVHCAGGPKDDDKATTNLAGAAARAGVSHIVHISVVGADRIPLASAVDRAMFGYFGAKLAAERIVEDSGLPFTILRSTQFHELILKVVEAMAKLPIVPVPAGFRFQPIDSGEVADRMVELALGAPAGRAPDVGGPDVHRFDGLVRDYLRARGKHRMLVPLPLPGKAARAFRDGANLTPDRAVGRRTWRSFLEERVTRAGTRTG